MGVRLVLLSSGSEQAAEPVVYEFDQARVAMGRGAGVDVRLPHRAVSGLHASVRAHASGYAVFDEGSTNGTRVGGQRIAVGRPKPLRTGDELGLGPFRFRVEVGVPIAVPTGADRTAALARALAQDAGPPQPPRLTVLNGAGEGTVMPLPAAPAELRVGRGAECDLVLDDADASREHLDLVVDADGVLARDRGSKNGFAVNGRPATERRLRDRDELRVGNTVLLFEDPLDGLLRNLERTPDEPYEPPPEPEPEPTPEQVPVAPEVASSPDGGAEFVESEASALASAPAKRAKDMDGDRRPGDGVADSLIYVLALLVLLVSAAGLYLLLRAE